MWCFQELEKSHQGGCIPRIVECELTDDLVGSAIPGDIITVVGTVEVCHPDAASSSGSSAGGPMDCYLLANYVLGEEKGPASSVVGPDLRMVDYYAIEEIHDQPQLFRLLVNSLCPAIYGHEVLETVLLRC